MNCVKTSLKQERVHPVQSYLTARKKKSVKINIVATELTRAKKKSNKKRALSS